MTGLTLAGSDFVVMPIAGKMALLPMSLIIIATICMTWTLRYWTTISWRRALKGIVISLSASWITALACIQGLTRKEGVFLRTSKTGAAGGARLRKALRISRVETLLAVALFTAFGLLVAFGGAPLLLLIVIGLQGAVYTYRTRRGAVEPARATRARARVPAAIRRAAGSTRHTGLRDSSPSVSRPPCSWRWCPGPRSRSSPPPTSWFRFAAATVRQATGGHTDVPPPSEPTPPAVFSKSAAETVVPGSRQYDVRFSEKVVGPSPYGSPLSGPNSVPNAMVSSQ